MTDEPMRDLVKECGLDWQRGYMQLFHDDPVNRYALLIEVVEAAVLRKLAEQPNPWRDVIDNELVCSHLGTWESFPDATTALNAVLNWHIDVSLSPEVSSDAEALVQRGRDEKDAEIARLREDAERYRWLREFNPTRFAIDLGASLARINCKADGQREMDAAIDAASKP